MAKKNKSQKDLLQNNRYRDVQGSQVMERGTMGKRKSPVFRTIVTIFLALLVAVCFYVMTGCMFAFGQILTSGQSIVHAADGFLDLALQPRPASFVVAAIGGIICLVVMGIVMGRTKKAQDVTVDTEDINQYEGDQHIATTEEVQQRFDIFPDVGAHSSVQVASMISHMALSNKGLDRVQMICRADKDILDENGDLLYLKGEPLLDDAGQYIWKDVPAVDEKMAAHLYEISGVPVIEKEHWWQLSKPEQLRKYYDATKIPYNPGGKDRDKLRYETWADVINEDWELPWYETQQPAGVYMVDTRPVNTMILAITRAGKGQTVIEPTIDMWSREKEPSNMVVNDPKGELLVKNYVKVARRGYQIVQFNLINTLKTDVYNPLFMAADAAREGEFTKCAAYIENMGDVFFPMDSGEDPVWPNAANNAFKRAAYGLIDFYLEEEHELRRKAEATGMSAKALDRQLNELWGKVTLYNVYQFFVQMTSKTLKNPQAIFNAKMSSGELSEVDDEEYERLSADAAAKGELWESKPEMDLLTLYFNATAKLPQNKLREMTQNANNALRSMAGAEKMLASY